MASLRDRLLASDPSLVRLRLGARATVATLLAAAILIALYAVHVMPGQPAALGTLMALWCTVAANDPSLRARRITAATFPIPAFLAVALTTLLNLIGGTLAASCGFVAIAASAMLLRHYGPRGFGCGQVALFGAFFSLFVPLQLTWLGLIAIAILIGVACGWFVTFFLIGDRPSLVLHAQRAALGARLRLIIELVQQAPTAGPAIAQRVRRALQRLNADVVAIDGLLASGAFALDAAARSRARRELLRGELAVDAYAAAALAHRADTDAQDREATAVLAAETRARDGVDRIAQLLRAAARAPHDRAIDAPFPPQPRPPQLGGLTTPVREAIQVALACGGAMVIGGAIPPHQDAWAALVAFIVFNASASSGEIRNRGIARTAGTFAGVTAGTLLVAAVGAQHVAAAIIGTVGLFATFYSFRASYAYFTFFLTMCVAMIYELVGRPADQLLLTRLMETLIGVACGLLVSRFVLPLRTHDVVAHAAHAFADKLRASIDASIAHVTGAAGDDPIAAVRAMDAALADVLARTVPLRSPRRGEPMYDTDATLSALSAAGVHARMLAMACFDKLSMTAGLGMTAECSAGLRAARGAVLASLDAFVQMLDGGPERSAQFEVQTVHDTGTVTDAVHALRLLADDVHRLSHQGGSLLSPSTSSG